MQNTDKNLDDRFQDLDGWISILSEIENNKKVTINNDSSSLKLSEILKNQKTTRHQDKMMDAINNSDVNALKLLCENTNKIPSLLDYASFGQENTSPFVKLCFASGEVFAAAENLIVNADLKQIDKMLDTILSVKTEAVKVSPNLELFTGYLARAINRIVIEENQKSRNPINFAQYPVEEILKKNELSLIFAEKFYSSINNNIISNQHESDFDVTYIKSLSKCLNIVADNAKPSSKSAIKQAKGCTSNNWLDTPLLKLSPKKEIDCILNSIIKTRNSKAFSVFVTDRNNHDILLSSFVRYYGANQSSNKIKHFSSFSASDLKFLLSSIKSFDINHEFTSAADNLFSSNSSLNLKFSRGGYDNQVEDNLLFCDKSEYSWYFFNPDLDVNNYIKSLGAEPTQSSYQSIDSNSIKGCGEIHLRVDNLKDALIIPNFNFTSQSLKSINTSGIILDIWYKNPLTAILHFSTAKDPDAVLDLFNNLKESTPEDWTDKNGNNIAHYAMFVLSGMKSSRTVSKIMVVANPEMISAKNNYGLCPIDAFSRNHLDYRNKLSSLLLKSSIDKPSKQKKQKRFI